MSLTHLVQNEQIEFLQQLLDQLRNDKIDQGTKRRLGEFMMTEKMCERLGSNESNESNDEQKWLKYFTLGWYIYEMLGIEGA